MRLGTDPSCCFPFVCAFQPTAKRGTLKKRHAHAAMQDRTIALFLLSKAFTATGFGCRFRQYSFHLCERARANSSTESPVWHMSPSVGPVVDHVPVVSLGLFFFKLSQLQAKHNKEPRFLLNLGRPETKAIEIWYQHGLPRTM